jgi:hypothetical protein
MKKIFLSLAAVALMGISAFANGTNGNDEIVSQKTLSAFKSDFTNASHTTWQQKEGFIKATFSLNGQVMSAYYDYDGELKAVVRNICSDQLPLNLLSSLKKDYEGYWITDLFEISADNETTYYVTVENSDKKIVLKSESASYWNVFSKAKKALAE